MRKIIHRARDSCTGEAPRFARDFNTAKGRVNWPLPQRGGTRKRKGPEHAGAWQNTTCRKGGGELAEGVHQFIDRAVEILVAPAQSVDLVDRMEDCGVMLAAKLPSDFRKRRLGKLLDQVHRNLSRERDGFRIGTNFKVLLAQTELLANLFLDQVDGNPLFLGGNDVAQYLLCRDQVQNRAGQGGIRHQASQSALELPH